MSEREADRERLQPALLDRLLDDAPHQRSEAPEQRWLSQARLRQAVLRDLAWLLNTAQPAELVGAVRAVRDSVLNYGLPALSGRLVSRLDVHELEQQILEAIERFEPRIVRGSLEVRAAQIDSLMDTHNVIAFDIRGLLWAQPVPLETLLRTEFDLEAGQVRVRDAAPASMRRER